MNKYPDKINIDEEKLLDEYLQRFNYKPELDMNEYREYVRKSYDFQRYMGKTALHILKEEIIKFFKPIFNRILAGGKMNKYRNKIIIIDGIRFDSKRESKRYLELKLLEKAKLISGLILQPSFEICPRVIWNGKTLRKRVYIADFQYWQKGQNIVEDVKGMKNQTYMLKRSLFLTQYPQYIFKEI